jgi:uncharacterized protein YyaL (SSP411 family)
MARESFEDASVAKVLNEGFVPVKIDREERPDLDKVYITACQLVRGSAGWPLTVLALPDGRPFFVATYLPRDSNGGRLGFLDLLRQIQDEWHADRNEMIEAAEEISSAVAAALCPEALAPISVDDARNEAIDHLLRDMDWESGGFGSRPKFPVPQKLLLLLQAVRSGNERAREAVRLSLDAMANGGIHDPLGGGFHRYSTDHNWKLPHFEKTIYDNALLLWVYAEAFAVLQEPRYRAVALSTARFLLTELRLSTGGLASGLDADTHGREGLTYTWTMSELREALPDPALELAALLYGATDQGNHLDEATGRPAGRNVLHRNMTLEAAARAMDLTETATTQLLEDLHSRLARARRVRPQPMRDEKQLADWNGMAVVALSRASSLLGEPSLLEAAEGIARAVLQGNRDSTGGLTHCAGEAAEPHVFLDDYAWMSLAYLELFIATGQPAYGDLAKDLAQSMASRFADPATGALFLCPMDSERLYAQPLSFTDGALPSGVSVAVLALQKIASCCQRNELAQAAASALGPLSRTMATYPEEHAFALLQS